MPAVLTWGGGKSRRFLVSKIKRLCPSLWVTVMVTVFIVGLTFTSLDFLRYLSHKKTWCYFLNCFFIVQHKLPGVFEKNVYTESINGALWSLPLEVLCYIALTVAFKLQLISEKMSARLAVFLILIGQLFIVLFARNINFLKMYQYHLHLCLVFFSGTLCCLFREKIYLDRRVQVIFALLLPVLIYFDVSVYIWIFFFLYCLLVTCFYDTGKDTVLSSLGKYSYEIYLVGFLVQQCVCYFFGGLMNPYINMVVSIPIAVVMGIVIYKVSTRLLSIWKKPL